MNGEALRRCERAANSCYNHGLQRARERDLSGAVPLLKRALRLNKRLSDARNLLGLIFFEMGETGEALVQWVLSLNLQPQDNRASVYLNDIRKRSGKLKAYTRMTEQYNAALELAKNGSRDTAVHQLSGILSQHPNYVRAGLLLSLLCMEAGEWGKAEHYLRQILETDRGNPDAVRYLHVVRGKRREDAEGQSGEAERHAAREEKRTEAAGKAYAAQGEESSVIIPSSYRESTGWQTILNIGIGLMIGATAVIFLYLPTKRAELEQAHNRELIAVGEQLSEVNHSLKEEKEKGSALTVERDDLQNQLNTIEESHTYKLSQYQKLIGILNDYRSDNYAHAANLFATIDVSQLTDIDDESGVSITDIYHSIAEKMNVEGYVSLYQQGENAYNSGDYTMAISYYDKALAINPDYEQAMYKKAVSYKQMGDIQNANNLFGEIIMRFPGTELARQAQVERGY